jgi:hypothetical protein
MQGREAAPACMTQVVWANKHCEGLMTGPMKDRVPISPASVILGIVRLGGYVVGLLSRNFQFTAREADFLFVGFSGRQYVRAS